MADEKTEKFSFDPRSGFSPEKKTFHSLRHRVPLPPLSIPLSFPSYAISLLPSPLPHHSALIDASNSVSLSFPTFFARVRSLSTSILTHTPLRHGQVAFVLSPADVDLPVLYFSLLSLGVVVAPANPVATASELARLVRLTEPTIAFAVSATASHLPPCLPVILLDSPQFRSFLNDNLQPPPSTAAAKVFPSDLASIQFSSGTTGRLKAAALTHRSLVAMTAGFRKLRDGPQTEITFLSAPMFHSLGFFFLLNSVALGDTVVFIGGGRKATFSHTVQALETYRATQMTAAPPLVVEMGRSVEVLRHDLSSLRIVLCGGAPLSEAAAERFMARFSGVLVCQGYGSTEGGGISRMIDAEECRRQKTVGRLTENVRAKVVDPITGESLSVGQPGELCIKSPASMEGYVGDEEANSMVFDSQGWMRTGDLCYIDEDGFLHIVDRLKEMIKYKAYQVPPAELEQVLQSSPEISDAAVIPFPQEEVGQIPMAFVVRQPGSKINEAYVMNFVAKQVAPYKKIRRVAFVEAIPKSAAGKILRKDLIALALSSPICRL
ncbi:hypothetical protein HPP92_008096 [Vanilla planifolia]|uniref:4-coumarate--CoA ligase n=1 Tax=Vanilla planifolia TaxID=51239 RepID=A0A835RJD3_VANPL|nr:hypothetical protein HPP92_008096 [Vanilla planifolia]